MRTTAHRSRPAARRGLAALLALAAQLGLAVAAHPDFLPGWSQPKGAWSFSVALGDVDGDGDLDAYVTDFFTGDTLWLNDGTGTFTDSGQSLDTGMGSLALLAPLDSGTSLDLWLSRHLASNRVWLNDGLGTFTDTGQSIGGAESRRGGALGDLDGDGDLDACVPTSSPTNPNRVYFNDGTGTFTDSGQSLGSYSSLGVALGDVDADGDLDALVANNGANKLWRNDGHGVFADTGQTPGTGGTFGVALGDLDGDGDLDAFFANGSNGGEANEVWRNNGSGAFTSGGQFLDDDYSWSLVLLDCEGDGDLDAFVGNNAGQPNRLYLNDGAAHFSDSGQPLGVGGGISVAAGDLDGDGDSDLFVANAAQPNQVFWNDGACHFTDSLQLLGGSRGISAALADLDGDGDQDALIGSTAGIVRVLLNDGAGGFTDSHQWLANGYGSLNNVLLVADLDGDGDRDLWVGNGGRTASDDDPADRLWWNDGAGTFTDSGQRLGSESTTDGALGDLDGDGDLDLVVANYPSLFSPGSNLLYLNQGGTFTASGTNLGLGNTTAVALGDLDGDQDLDIFFANRGEGSKVWRNAGGGSFTDSGQSLGSAQTFCLALGDLDGDQDLDAFFGNGGGNTVWLNDGTGVFTDSAQSLGTLNTVAVHLLDVDGDGDLDAWTTNGSGGPEPAQVWLNDGSAHFTDSGWLLASSLAADSALGNVDDDTDLDVLVVSGDGDHQLWVNQYSGPLFADGFESGDTTAWTLTEP